MRIMTVLRNMIHFLCMSCYILWAISVKKKIMETMARHVIVNIDTGFFFITKLTASSLSLAIAFIEKTEGNTRVTHYISFVSPECA